ncbi:hypothetical protein [Blastococcus sp. TBT05-19]|uniref:hypothetical protein n=1 Tax=Blastococcus sp. TBT05-19 TaxID=2250581 RepID=UPI0011BD752B|nr:hypothetical protein [Blastococcus sp. TBT05-19]
MPSAEDDRKLVRYFVMSDRYEPEVQVGGELPEGAFMVFTVLTGESLDFWCSKMDVKGSGGSVPQRVNWSTTNSGTLVVHRMGDPETALRLYSPSAWLEVDPTPFEAMRRRS